MAGRPARIRAPAWRNLRSTSFTSRERTARVCQGRNPGAEACQNAVAVTPTPHAAELSFTSHPKNYQPARVSDSAWATRWQADAVVSCCAQAGLVCAIASWGTRRKDLRPPDLQLQLRCEVGPALLSPEVLNSPADYLENIDRPILQKLAYYPRYSRREIISVSTTRLT